MQQIWQGVASCAVILLAEQWLLVWAIVGTASVIVFAGPTIWAKYQQRPHAPRAATRASDLYALADDTSSGSDALGRTLRGRSTAPQPADSSIV